MAAKPMKPAKKAPAKKAMPKPYPMKKPKSLVEDLQLVGMGAISPEIVRDRLRAGLYEEKV